MPDPRRRGVVPWRGLDNAQIIAAQLGADAISNSWSGGEGGDQQTESIFDQIGVGIFASTGDRGYRDGPQYPATSLHVIAVGGTSVWVNPATGVSLESAWSLAGSSCSTEFAAPSFQPTVAACTNRAAADVSALADPNTGVSIYSTAAGGWTSVGGTSASSPLVTAILTAAGHPDANPAFVYRHPEAFTDITQGSNGTCGTTLCDAGSGWDGPTGLGSPLQDALVAIGHGVGPAVSITEPADGSTQLAAFTVSATVGDGASHVDLRVDGRRIVGLAAAPYTFSAPALTTPGMHTVEVSAFTDDHDVGSAVIHVLVPAPAPDAGPTMTGSDADPTSSSGGCAAGGSGGSALAAAGIALTVLVRRRAAR